MARGGWGLVGTTAVVVSSIVFVLLATFGWTKTGLLLWVRVTAAISSLLFLAAFLASSARAVRRNQATAWLLRNRRYLGLSFALSHAIHLSGVASLSVTTAFRPEPAAAIVGGVATIFIGLMAATSFDRSAAWLGPRRWRRIHVTGLYVVWTTFAVTYAQSLDTSPAAPAVLALFVSALGARLWIRRRRHPVRDGVVG